MSNPPEQSVVRNESPVASAIGFHTPRTIQCVHGTPVQQSTHTKSIPPLSNCAKPLVMNCTKKPPVKSISADSGTSFDSNCSRGLRGKRPPPATPDGFYSPGSLYQR